MILYNFILLLILIVTLSECHDHQHHGVKGRTGHTFKSYGGYFPETAGYNEASNHFINTQNYHHSHSSPYQPYGWSFNQPRRTYGGVNVLNHQREDNHHHVNSQHPPNHIGWNMMNNYPKINANPIIPPLPQPNFAYPNLFPQFPFPSFPNMNPYPNNYPHYNPNYVYPNNVQFHGHGPEHQRPDVGNNFNNQGGLSGDNNRNPANTNNLPPNNGQFPIHNFNQGRPIVNTNANTGEPGNYHPNRGHLPYPQNNQMPVVPSDNKGVKTSQSNRDQLPKPQIINSNTPGISNIQPNQGQQSIPQSVSDKNVGEVDFQFPKTIDAPKAAGSGTLDDINVRYSENNNDTRSSTGSNPKKNFVTNSFFENNNRRQWTNEDELKWQATTKAPYFENKLPGLECTLPAAAVLSATNAFKVSSLLPLNVPIGKPILSCNATNLMQSQIRLDGKVYDCFNSDIEVSCDVNLNDCEVQIIECDTENSNADTIWCTNGTLLSNEHVVCESASITASKSMLNCIFKEPLKSNLAETTNVPVINILPVLPLPSNNDANKGIDNKNQEDSLEYDDITIEPQDLMPQVKNAMKNVFPHDLFIQPSNRYLPPKIASPPQIDSNLKNHINGVFNVDLLASSNNGNEEEDNNVQKVSIDDFSDGDLFEPGFLNSVQITDKMRSNWNIYPNVNTNSNRQIKTKTFENRFADLTRQEPQDHPLKHRLIFTN